MAEKNSDSEANLDSKFESIGKDYRPPVDSLIGFYNRGHYTIGLVKAHSDQNKSSYKVFNYLTNEIEEISDSTEMICNKACEIKDPSYIKDARYNINKLLKKLESYKILAKRVTPVLEKRLDMLKKEETSLAITEVSESKMITVNEE
ncbi:MAG: hypothetical protein JSW73_00005 [Candidatus Woesearchaeota archaeon]|nr:MAG: hypothetical protein JSW73_00005 [Candidatus Woesearchaeota archaeon]